MALRPKIISAYEAAGLIPTGSSIMFSGFVGCGCALDVVEAMARLGQPEHICGIFDDPSLPNAPDGREGYGYSRLIHTGQLDRCITGYLANDPEAERRWAAGLLHVDLVPQGSLAEMIRAGGSGLGGVVTPTGVGTLVEQSPFTERRLTIDGRDYLLMRPLKADFALVSGAKVDRAGNIWYAGTTRNFAPLMCMAADTVIVEAEELVDIGAIAPENVVTPGILVDYIVVRGGI
ncbi:MAG: 3-oxoacid CoA-transferase subunit A [Oscillospiraceae bacterium]|nr:3-oxoacid CoA-transferase subunit A [Oscillospiraceae bacterium]MCD8066325.1 3-oxoacid CoA-transferase subunit A [Oscillospiraceae bacterium]